MSAGLVLDLFDVGDVEILRGPQGLLFGRNTTGGAVLINSRRPGPNFAVRARASYETGPQGSAGLSVEGPLGGGFAAKLTGYYSDDRGWFENSFDGSSFGELRNGFVRPTLTWTGDNFDATLIVEHGSTRGDGASAQNPLRFSGFDIGLDHRGYNELDWKAVMLETNLVLGPRTITNILGARSLDQAASSDIDGQPFALFHGFNKLDQSQWS